MRSIKSRDTKPEIYLRKFLFANGLRYKVAYNKLPGKPDIAFVSKKLAIFVHGCFWHQHQNCKITNFPSRNIEFWLNKFKKNQERDKKTQAQLIRLGWKPLVIWECEILDINRKVRDLGFVLEKIGK